MKKTRIVKNSFRIMGRYKLRTFLMMLGVVVGIAALTVIISVGKGTQKKINSTQFFLDSCLPC